MREIRDIEDAVGLLPGTEWFARPKGQRLSLGQKLSFGRAQGGEAAVHEMPCAVLARDVGFDLAVMRLLVGEDVFREVPREERQAVVDIDKSRFQPLAGLAAHAPQTLEVQHAALGHGGAAEGAARCSGVMQDEEFLGAVRIRARLQEIPRLDESLFPLECRGARFRLVQAVDEGAQEELFEVWPEIMNCDLEIVRSVGMIGRMLGEERFFPVDQEVGFLGG